MANVFKTYQSEADYRNEQSKNKKRYAGIYAALKNMKIKLSFLPISKRDDLENDEWSIDAIHYSCVLSNGAESIHFFYSLGSAHKYVMTGNPNNIEHTSTHGKVVNKTPEILDVVYSLLADASDINNGADFEEWCSNFGYDTDSPKAEKIFNACKENAAKLNKLISKEEQETLYNLYWELGY